MRNNVIYGLKILEPVYWIEDVSRHWTVEVITNSDWYRNITISIDKNVLVHSVLLNKWLFVLGWHIILSLYMDWHQLTRPSITNIDIWISDWLVCVTRKMVTIWLAWPLLVPTNKWAKHRLLLTMEVTFLKPIILLLTQMVLVRMIRILHILYPYNGLNCPQIMC